MRMLPMEDLRRCDQICLMRMAASLGAAAQSGGMGSEA
jgi:hypothetical protein